MMYIPLYWSSVYNDVCNGVSFDLILYLFVSFSSYGFLTLPMKRQFLSKSRHFHNILRHQRLLAQPKFTETNTYTEPFPGQENSKASVLLHFSTQH